MANHDVVSREAWTAARIKLLARDWYNYSWRPFGSAEAPGASVFLRDAGGQIYHTYSCYARGLDAMNGAYQWLDLVPKGRDEAGLPYNTAWVRHHDKYGA